MAHAAKKQDDNHGLKEAVAQFESIREMVDDLNAAEALRDQDDNSEAYEEAEQAIHDDPLSVMVRGSWHEPGKADEEGPSEFEILLCTGGPAVRIIGKLDEHCQPVKAIIQHQDWFKPWTDWQPSGASDKQEILLPYCRQFYFGD